MPVCLQAYFLEKAAGLVPGEEDEEILQMVEIAKAAASTARSKAETAGGVSQENFRTYDGNEYNKKQKEPRPAQDGKGEGASGSRWDNDRGGSSSGTRDESKDPKFSSQYDRSEKRPPKAKKPRSTGNDHSPTGDSHGRQKKLPRWRMHLEFIRQLFTALFNIALNALAHYGSWAMAMLPDVLPWIAGESSSYRGTSPPCMSPQVQLH